MEHLTIGILSRSSDAVVIIGLADGTVLDVNEALFAATGHTRRELVGRPARDLLVRLGQTAGSTTVEALQGLGWLTDAPIGIWTRSGELRVADLSALVLEFNGQRDALCTIRGVRDPTPGQRRSAAREELVHLLGSGDTGPESATRALQAFGGCLRWELGALWRGGPPTEHLRCAATWHVPQLDLGSFEETSQYATFPPRVEALRRTWLRGEPTWIPDVLAHSELPRAPVASGEPMRGWLGFPALRAGGVIGVVEFISRETRQPDAELLAMLGDLGHLYGRLLEDVEASGVRLGDQADTVQLGTPEPPPGTMPAAFRDLAGAVAAATEALERPSTAPEHVPPAASLDELTAGMGKLNQLLENAVQSSAGEPPAMSPSTPSGRAAVELPPPLPTGLTLKAVSRRTGIPAATLRTWEHRYGFLRPRRSANGYRLYGEEEIARIERVKNLVRQGVRIGVAMKAVVEEATSREPTDEAQQPPDQETPGESGKHAEVYRLTPRSPRGRRS
jgi:DNA-binding transcriptional MerR regulator/PAS domain-containing protein